VILAAENLVLGNAPYCLLILQDITQRIRLETELRQSQKMESVGRLAARVAHDFNNILTVILGNASLELCKEGLDAELSTSLHEVVLAAERATALTRQLLAYSRKQIIQPRPLGLNAMLEQSVATLRWLIGTHIAVDLRLAPGLPPIFADANRLDQVVMNLALNARDAMGDGGTLTFTTSLAELDDAGRARHPGTEAQRFGCLAVQDTGHGMNAATLAHIFEPFFTTKDPGKGTGMGLATVYGILSQHAGWVDVESGPGCGTTFRVYFPLSTEAAEEKPALSVVAPAAPPHGKKSPSSSSRTKTRSANLSAGRSAISATASSPRRTAKAPWKSGPHTATRSICGSPMSSCQTPSPAGSSRTGSCWIGRT